MDKEIQELKEEINLLKEELKVKEKHSHNGFDSVQIHLNDISKSKGEVEMLSGSNSNTQPTNLYSLADTADLQDVISLLNELVLFVENQVNSSTGISTKSYSTEDIYDILLNNGFIKK